MNPMPRCQRLISTRKHPDPHPCNTPCVQNSSEKERGVWWCAACQKYPWGNGGGRAGGGPDLKRIPKEAWL